MQAEFNNYFFNIRKLNRTLRSLPIELTSMRVQEWRQTHRVIRRVQVAARVVMKILIQALEVIVDRRA